MPPPPVSTRTCLTKQKPWLSCRGDNIHSWEKYIWPVDASHAAAAPQRVLSKVGRKDLFLLLCFNRVQSSWRLSASEARGAILGLRQTPLFAHFLCSAATDVKSQQWHRSYIWREKKKQLTVDEAALWCFGRGLFFFWCWVKNKNFKKANYVPQVTGDPCKCEIPHTCVVQSHLLLERFFTASFCVVLGV